MKFRFNTCNSYVNDSKRVVGTPLMIDAATQNMEKYKGDKVNMFSVISKAGVRE